MDKTNIYFPGYGRCIACQTLVLEKEFPNHTLNCRSTISNDNNICSVCHQTFEKKILKQHMETCQQQINAHSQFNQENDQGYQTPRAQTPTQIETDYTIKQTKLCDLCQQDIESSDYRNHLASCYTHRSSSNEDNNTSTQSFNEVHKERKTKHCGLCKQDIESSEFRNHVASCSIDRSSSTVKKDNSTQSLNEVHKERKTKHCGLCKQDIESSEFRNHVSSCSTHRPSPPEDTNTLTQSLNEVQKERKTKHCGLCKQDIESSEYRNHVVSCSIDRSSSTVKKDNSTQSLNEVHKERKTKHCGLCKQDIESSEYRNHVTSCSIQRSSPPENRNNSTPSLNEVQKERKTKHCGLCKQEIDSSEYLNHVVSCSIDRSSSTRKRDSSSQSLTEVPEMKKTKVCPSCNELIDQLVFVNHLQSCSKKQIKKKPRKYCGLCEQDIDASEYRNHVASCSKSMSESEEECINYSSEGKRRSEQDLVKDEFRTAERSAKQGKKRDCIICFKPVDLSEFEAHVGACAAALDQQSSTFSSNKKFNCLTCNRSLTREDNNYQMNCHSHHFHCLSCLRDSMEEFARTRQTPICHRTLCDYQLSRHDISLIPLARHISDRLLKVAKGEQRPFCSKCHFYVHLNENEHFDEHFQRCGDPIPCEYCLLPYSFAQLEDHMKECLDDQTSQNEKLILFILSRTKYPFSKQQIRIYIQHHPNQSDPNLIVDELAIFGATFPYEIPTRECGICVESRPYDDIYVFDCDESHKICYDCYSYSCQTKMNAGEILTCALCPHPLRDGELNQLRIPGEQLQIIRDYQMKKTFEIYSSRTRGIIKCPNQNCTWVAEAEDPNERFKVQCPKCEREFCSLCNEQYHYRTKCQQLTQITQRWFFWCETERARYLNIRAQQDNQYAQQLHEYNQQTKENENRNKDLRRRYEELMTDEQYKVQNCRLCPSCKRVVQRLEGCDSMICGQDAHGGNLQSGCGAKFNWTQAQPYTAATTQQQPRQVMLDLPKPEHPIVHHDGVKCDFCQEDVNGIRFDCVHCPALTYCEKCEQQATLNHSRENEDNGQQQHVFRLIMEPHEELYLF